MTPALHTPATVAIIGAGASGTLTAIHLLGRRDGPPLQITIYDPSQRIGRGVAYGTMHDEHLLNVPAAAMSAFPQRSDDFVRWLDAHGLGNADARFVSRRLFGEYLEDRFEEAVAARAPETIVVRVPENVVSIQPSGGGAVVRETSGGSLYADAVVLATGTDGPGVPPCVDQLVDDDRFVVDPWASGALDRIGGGDIVTLMGTGLTAVDVITTLSTRGDVGKVYAFSRRGLIPHAHRESALPRPMACPDTPLAPYSSARDALRAVRHRAAARLAVGESWHEVIDELRSATPTLWHSLPEEERHRFVRHLERYWEQHRHRMAPVCAQRIDAMRAKDQLKVTRGRLTGWTAGPDGLEIEVRRGHALARWNTDWIVNCTGSRYCVDSSPETHSVAGRLIADGLARPGWAGLGLDVDECGRVRGTDGAGAPWLWTVGAMRRGQLYETTAVPEIRVQAMTVASAVIATCTGGATASKVWAEPRAPKRLEVITSPVPDVGNRSYLVHDGTTGVVIDPQCDTSVMVAAAQERNVSISHVFETHIHNDYVSGGLTLARAVGANYIVSADEPVNFGSERRGVRDGDVLMAGAIEISVMHTPGHTPHHLSYAMRLGGKTVLFSGGSLLHDATGRTDLFDPHAADLLARAQWRALRRMAESLPPETALFPTHGFGSFCSATPVGDIGPSSLGEQQARNPVFTQDEDSFLASLQEMRRPHPRYYQHMAPFNRSGRCQRYPAAVSRVELHDVDPDEGSIVVDLRPRRAFAACHRRGALNIELADAFAAYFGWSVPWGAPVVLVAEEWAHIDRASGALARIGIDHVRGALHRDVDGDASYPVATFRDMRRTLATREIPWVLDTRDWIEWVPDHLVRAQHVPFYCMEGAAPLVRGAPEVWVHCARGYRAAIAASLLERSGLRPVLVDDRFEEAVRLGLTVSSSATPGHDGAIVSAVSLVPKDDSHLASS